MMMHDFIIWWFMCLILWDSERWSARLGIESNCQIEVAGRWQQTLTRVLLDVLCCVFSLMI